MFVGAREVGGSLLIKSRTDRRAVCFRVATGTVSSAIMHCQKESG